KDNQSVHQALAQELAGDARTAFNHEMPDVEAAQRLKRGRQVLGLEYIDARVVQRSESSNRWVMREDDCWRLLRGSDKRGVEGSLGVSIEDGAHWRHSRTDGSSRRQLWIVGAHGSHPDCDRVH